ncbi:MAG: ABC transporter permease [Nocardioides sp.]|uniref:ABC transporter permease n=1 Tax=Nocardioides sp. TaxID=35761 RepID=UPI003EFC2341
MSTVTTAPAPGATHVRAADGARRTHRPIPFTRIVAVELRKMFDTRSGFWLMAGVVLLSVIASGAVLLFGGKDDVTYANMSSAIGIPMAILLPVIAILSVTSEWSQRTGLTTFTLVPHRGRILLAKGVNTVLVGVVSMVVAMGIGALTNLLGALAYGIDSIWETNVADLSKIVLANVLGMLIGLMLGLVIRNSPGAIVSYFVYWFVLGNLFFLLAQNQQWFADVERWINFQYNQTYLFDQDLVAKDWAYLGVSGLIWLVVPIALGTWRALRAEVK